MLRRRRSLLLKIIIGSAVVYIGFLLLVGRGSSDSSNSKSSDVQVSERHEGGTPGPFGLNTDRLASGLARAGDIRQPVIERPNLDRLRFEEKMHRDAERDQLRRQRLEEERKHHEEDRRRRAMDRKRIPFGSNIIMDNNSSFSNRAVKTNDAQQLAIDKIQPLIDVGLLVVKWNGEKEKPAVPGGPGENGEAVTINKEELSAVERAKFDLGWQNNAFNQYASDMISLHRSLPDIRDEECRTLQYRDVLPSASVVIIFHNEAWSVLLRTVHSVMDRSPPHLIKEVILVDDFSDLEHLKKPLDDYAEKMLKVRVMRNKKREGLIRARLLGASVAAGDVIVFLDSHCECSQGWLEPMLDRIAENKSNVVTPIIDVLSDDSLRYQYSSARSTSVGGFDWNLQFNWHAIPERERQRRKSPVDPVWSPTMAGGLFAISREYFEYLGTYDPGMDIWGGENLELSFRVWMCGGVLEIVVCSHVGHIFRKRSPYKWRTGVNVVKKNSIRLAQVWMDDYAKYYFDRFNNDLGDFGDVTSRKELRKKLQCKSFDWYLKNIFPELFIPGDASASGDIRNKAMGTFNGNHQLACIDSAVDKNAHNQPVKLWPCHNQGGNQFWMLSASGEIRRDEGCIDYAGQFIMIYPCHSMKGNQEWIYGTDNTLRHRNTNLCIELSYDGTKLEMKPCTGIDRQIWYWKRKDENAVAPSISPV